MISKHRTDISIFQKEILNLKTKLTETQAALSYREQESDEAVRLAQDGSKDPNILYQATRQQLINAVLETTLRFNKMNQERMEYKKFLSESRVVKRQFEEIQISYLELQEANVKQCKYIEKIQKQLEKVEMYQTTILMQEKVINKMQRVMENSLGKASTTSASALASSGSGFGLQRQQVRYRSCVATNLLSLLRFSVHLISPPSSLCFLRSFNQHHNQKKLHQRWSNGRKNALSWKHRFFPLSLCLCLCLSVSLSLSLLIPAR
jgi:hypothetical protein